SHLNNELRKNLGVLAVKSEGAVTAVDRDDYIVEVVESAPEPVVEAAPVVEPPKPEPPRVEAKTTVPERSERAPVVEHKVEEKPAPVEHAKIAAPPVAPAPPVALPPPAPPAPPRPLTTAS